MLLLKSFFIFSNYNYSNLNFNVLKLIIIYLKYDLNIFEEVIND